jgi:hypothetical protein
MKKPLFITKDHKIYSPKNKSFLTAHELNYGKKYFNEKVKVQSPDDILGKNVAPSIPKVKSAWKKDEGTFEKKSWKFSDEYECKWDMSIYYDNSNTSSTSTYIYGSSTGNFYYQPVQWGYFSKIEPTIGEEPKMSIPNSMDKTFNQFQDEWHKENHAFNELVQKQAQKLKQEYQHEQIAYQKQMEVEQQKADMPIYSVEFATARVFLQYYANLALQKPAPSLKPEQIMQVSKYLAATISCELRHRRRKCTAFWSRALFLWDMLDEWGVDDHCSRRDAGKRFLGETEDWDNFMVEQYLKLGAYIFGGSWEGGFGGWPWASVAWYAGDWVYSALNNKGNIPLILWEKMLNAAHNNGRWMNKLGMGNVMGVLNMGANADPSFIADIAKKALIVDNPNDFKRIIEKWTSCDLPGEKDKLELPNPGVIVDTSRYKSQKKSYLPILKKQEEDLKAKDVEAKLVLDAPELAPVEMGVSEGDEKESTGYTVDAIKDAVAKAAAKKTHFKEEAVAFEDYASLKMKTDKTIKEQLKEQQQMATEALKKSIKEKQAVLKKTAGVLQDLDVLATGIKLPWKGPKNPMKAPTCPNEALKVFTETYYQQVFGAQGLEVGIPVLEEASVKKEDKETKAIDISEPGGLEALKKAMEPQWGDESAKDGSKKMPGQPPWAKSSKDDEFTDDEVSVRTPKDKGGTHGQVAAG